MSAIAAGIGRGLALSVILWILGPSPAHAVLPQGGAARAPGTPRDADDRPPPGIPPEDVARRVGRDAAARSLAEILALLGPIDAVDGPTIAPLDPGSREAEEARARGARGAESLAQGKALKAVTEFESALSLDPGDPELLRSLAKAYTQLGNEQRALEAYERLLLLRPMDPQALVATGVAAASKRNYEDAVRRLSAGLMASERGGPEARLPSAPTILGWRTLAGGLREMEFDGAAIDALDAALSALDALEASLAIDPDADRPDTSRMRAEILLARADASIRLGRHAVALEDLESIARLPGADPDIVLARELLVLERDGRWADAERRLARSMSASGSAPTPRQVELAEWLVCRRADRPVLVELAKAAASAQPLDPMTARLVAAVEPQRGAAAFARILAQAPWSSEAWRGYLRAVAAGSAEGLAQELVERLREIPAGAEPALGAALAAGVRERDLRRALLALPESPQREALLTRLAITGRDLAGAWTRITAARERWPADADLAIAQIETVAALDELTLLDALERGAAGTASGLPDDREVRISAALARRAAGDPEGARARLESIIEQVEPSPREPAARTALAGLLAEEAASLRTDDVRRRAVAQRSALMADQALALDPEAADAALILLRLFDPRQGVLADPVAWGALRDRLRAGPLAWLHERVLVEEELARGRVDAAIERARRLAEARPQDGDLVGLTVSLLARSGRAAEAVEWLDGLLERQPGLVSLRDARLSAKVAAGQSDEMIQELTRLLEEDPGDALAEWHLEAILRGVGRQEEAVVRSRERIRARPAGPRRSLELAHLESRAGRPAEALAALDEIGADTPLTAMQRVAAVDIASRLPSSIPGRNDLLIDFAMRGIELAEGVEAVVFAAAFAIGAVDEARDGTRAEREEALREVRRLAAMAAARSSASPEDMAAALRWRDSAQVIVEAELPAAAAEFLRARLQHDAPLPEQALRILQSAAFACDAAAGGRATSAIDLLRTLRRAGQRPFGWTRDGAESEASALMALSTLFTLVGDREGAEVILDAVLQTDPGHAMAMNNLAWSRLERGVIDSRTIELAERAFELAPEEPAIVDTLGWVRYHLGQIQDEPEGGRPGALSLLRRSARLGAENPSVEVLDHLGDALWLSGDREGAVATWREVQRLVLERFDRNRIMPQIANHLLSETGVRLVDPERFYDEQFGRPLQRAMRKIGEAAQAREPSIAVPHRTASP